ncbi:hypothetical protein NIES3275_17460 [Microchaete diplosiphon NIES-3275]|nr:hypothetical protein NIES3275_17460 [Microchaete diplosiphon NIES-3275]
MSAPSFTTRSHSQPTSQFFALRGCTSRPHPLTPSPAGEGELNLLLPSPCGRGAGGEGETLQPNGFHSVQPNKVVTMLGFVPQTPLALSRETRQRSSSPTYA